MPLFSTEAFVLSTLRLGEADKLLTFFSLTRGKITGVAKGARQFKNRFGASLEPFTQCHLVLFEKGGGQLARIRQADIIHSFYKLREEWEKIELGTQMVRFVLRMTPEEEPHPAIYHLLQEALAFIESGLNRPLTFILFMAKLIKECGYKPEWNWCVRCRGKGTLFSYKEGGVVCARCAEEISSIGISSDGLFFLQTISKIDFQSAHRKFPSLSLLIKREAETVLRDYIAYLYRGTALAPSLVTAVASKATS